MEVVELMRDWRNLFFEAENHIDQLYELRSNDVDTILERLNQGGPSPFWRFVYGYVTGAAFMGLVIYLIS